MTLNKAISTAKKEVNNPYAQVYLQAIPQSIEMGGEHGFKIQILYALNNMATWRGETARKVKKILRDYAKKG